MNQNNKPNRLINEKSPYLLQHAYNPVEWYAWGNEAFEKAKAEDKPIFLSVGYSTCYWCHVMEREIFENDKMAELMNKYFVSIKVDREERPDVDRVYMTALQAMTGSGGWPMSMFLTPELKPFYGATYIPPNSKYGMPGFEDLVTEINKAWKTRRTEIENSGNTIIKHISQFTAQKSETRSLTEEIFKKGIDQFKGGFDEEYGGFGSAPKFPRPVGLNFLMRAYARYRDEDVLKMVIRTLFQMAIGGIYDHLGGGFHRYSVDRFWIVPHFEKMLYDQAQLVSVYIDAYQLTKEKYFADSARDVLNYVERKLTAPDGGFYSAEDAESAVDSSKPDEKEEGAFYVWEKSEIDNLLGEKNSEIFCYYYGVGARGNAPAGSDPHNVFMNKNILHQVHSLSDTSNNFNITADETDKILTKAKKILFKAREKRLRPHLDDKILTSWNGLIISAFAKAYNVFGDEKYIDITRKSADFILKNLFKNKILLHRYRDGEARYDGTLEDYAFFIQSLIDLFEACFDEKYLEKAIEFTNLMIEYFYDKENGGFFDTSDKDKSILFRTKGDYDSAEPTGNSIAIMDLLRLSQLTENEDYNNKAIESLSLFSGKMTEQPYGTPQMLCALDFSLNKPKQIIIAGNKNNKLAKEMIREFHNHYIPNKILIFAETGKENKLIPFLSSILKASEKTTAYVCENYACKLPVHSLKDLMNQLTGE